MPAQTTIPRKILNHHGWRNQNIPLKIKLKQGINLKGEYTTKYGSLGTTTFTHHVYKDANSLNITYDLYIDEKFIDTFDYNLKYSIDT